MESKSIDQLYTLLEPMAEKSRSRLQDETPQEKQRRLQLQDAARAVSALSYLRSVAPTSEIRRELQREATNIAAQAVTADLSGKVLRGEMHGAASHWDYLKKKSEHEQKDKIRYGAIGP
jgi:hypothetical protein